MLSTYFPNKLISSGFSKLYGYSLHEKKHGEWNYSLTWKPHEIPKVNLGFISAIYNAQKKIQNKPYTVKSITLLGLRRLVSLKDAKYIKDGP